jgi:hypothetical protein
MRVNVFTTTSKFTAWAIFTEVQRYYDAGLTVPDDVLLLFCDNNWGYIRRTEPAKEKASKGGSRLHYHIDLNGGPWNDRWINTTTIPKLREQYNVASLLYAGVNGPFTNLYGPVILFEENNQILCVFIPFGSSAVTFPLFTVR